MGNTQSDEEGRHPSEDCQPPGSWDSAENQVSEIQVPESHTAKTQTAATRNAETQTAESEASLDAADDYPAQFSKELDNMARELSESWGRYKASQTSNDTMPGVFYRGTLRKLTLHQNPIEHVAMAHLMTSYHANMMIYAGQTGRLGAILRGYQKLSSQFLQLVHVSKAILLKLQNPEALEHIQRVQIAEGRDDDEGCGDAINAVEALMELHKALMLVVDICNVDCEKAAYIPEIDKIYAEGRRVRDGLIAEYRKREATPGTLQFYQAMVADHDLERSELLEREKKLENQLKNIRETGKETAPMTRDTFMTLDLAKEMQQKMDRMEEKMKKLRVESSKTGDLRKEVRGLKEKLKEGHVKDLEEKLRQTRSERDEARAQLKDKDKNEAETQPLIQTDTNAETNLTFSTSAISLFAYQKTILRDLRKTVAEMRDSRGGSGWSIVDRAESLVNDKTGLLIREIDRCLALRESSEVEAARESERIEKLELDGFPALVSKAAADGEGDGGWPMKAKMRGKGRKGI